MHDAANFFVATDNGIEFAFAREGSEVLSIFFEGLKLAFGSVGSDWFVATEVFDDLEGVCGVDVFEEIGGLKEGEENVFDRDVFVAKFFGLLTGFGEGFAQVLASLDLAALDLGDFCEKVFGLLLKFGAIDLEFFEERRDERVFLFEHGGEQMGVVDKLMILARGDFCRLVKQFLSFDCEVIFDLHFLWV